MDAAWILLVLVAAGVNSLPASQGHPSTAGPVQHTANFAGQAGWTNPPTTTAPTISGSGYDRYGQPINAGRSTLPPPPSITNGAQSAFNNSSAAVRDSVESGIRAANQQFGTTGAVPTATASQQGWTSIGTAIPAPPLLIPQSPMTTTNFGNSNSTTGRSTLSFPATTTNTQQPLHSVLAEPQPAAATAPISGGDWGNSFSNNTSGQQATMGRSGTAPSLGSTVRESELVTLPMNSTSMQDPRNVVAARPNSGFPEDNSWAQAGQPSLGSPNGTIGSAPVNRQASSNGMSNAPFNSQQPISSPNTTMSGYNNAGTNPSMGSNMGQSMGNNGMNQNGQYPNGQLGQNGRPLSVEQSSWLLTTMAVLGLAGSLAANLFLGMSYMDARQKYQSLVRKTADTFRRVKAVAA